MRLGDAVKLIDLIASCNDAAAQNCWLIMAYQKVSQEVRGINLKSVPLMYRLLDVASVSFLWCGINFLIMELSEGILSKYRQHYNNEQE